MADGPFRQQCPSCEAQILIKDPKQIGKKADCPKCKYRFVIERPPETEQPSEVEVVDDATPAAETKKPDGPAAKRPAASAAAPAKKEPAATVRKRTRPKDDDDEDVGFKAKKKDGSGNLVLILGIGLAVIALGLLVAGGWYVFMTSDSGTGPVTRTSAPTTGPAKTTEPEDETPKGPKYAELANLLPNDTEGVYHVNTKNLQRSLIGIAALDTPGAFQRKPLEEKLGVKLDELEDVVIAHNLKAGWLFAAVRTSKPVPLKAMQEKLGLQAAEAPIKKQDYFVSAPSPWLDNLSRLFLEVNYGVAPPKDAPRQRTLALHVVDEMTFVLADLDQMKAFLEAGGSPKVIAKPDPRPAPNAPKPSNRWLSINPALKNVLDRIEAKTPFIAAVAWDINGFRDALQRGVTALKALQMADDKTAALVDDMQAVGLSLQIRDVSTLTLAVDAKTAKTGNDLQAELRNLGQVLSRGGATFDLDGNRMLPPAPKIVPGQPPVTVPAGPTYLVRSTLGSTVPVFTVEVKMPPEGNQNLLRDVLRPRMIELRGLSEMATGKPRLFELAGAMQAYVKQNNAFPRGTADRKGTNFGRPFPPDQRVSWMATLLPFLGQDDIAKQINPERGWKPEPDPTTRGRWIDENARAALALVPAFLDPATPPPSWWVTLPSVPEYSFGATQFVGIAGVGLDAAEYAAEDALVAKKLGIFGYNRATKPDDVKDGLATTIAVIQVPLTYKRPWIAGGGATVAGVPETKSIAPFVSTLRDGKRGTYAIMGDGSVRFISADISDDIFKAMVTINGGEKVDIDKMAPLVTAPDAKK